MDTVEDLPALFERRIHELTWKKARTRNQVVPKQKERYS